MKKDTKFCSSLKLPTLSDCISSIGDFPCNEKIEKRVERSRLVKRGRQSISRLYCSEHIPHEYHFLPELFHPIPKPVSRDDWLAQYAVNAQSFQKWEKNWSKSERLLKTRNVIYLASLGDIDQGIIQGLSQDRLVSDIQEYVSSFYLGFEVRILGNIQIHADDKSLKAVWNGNTYTLRSRIAHPYDLDKTILFNGNKLKNRRQLKVDPLLSMLVKILPRDAFSLCCITMEDLYDGDSDSFTGGMACGGSGVGVFSFFRYISTFQILEPSEFICNDIDDDDGDVDDHDLDDNDNGDDGKCRGRNIGMKLKGLSGKKKNVPSKCDAIQNVSTENNSYIREDYRILLSRSCKVVAHEIGHMFKIGHCTYFQCLMNGSGNLEEDFRQPFYLCPIDLHKVQHATGCNVWERYQSLLMFYKKFQMKEETKWVERRLQIAREYGCYDTDKVESKSSNVSNPVQSGSNDFSRSHQNPACIEKAKTLTEIKSRVKRKYQKKRKHMDTIKEVESIVADGSNSTDCHTQETKRQRT